MDVKKASLALGIALAAIIVAAVALRNRSGHESPERGVSEKETSPGAAVHDAQGTARPSAPATRPGNSGRTETSGGSPRPKRMAPILPRAEVPPAGGVPGIAVQAKPPEKVLRAGTATITGTVTAAVRPTAAPPTDVRGWPHCAELYPEGIPSESAVIDKKNRVKWAIVRLRSAPPEQPPGPRPRMPFLTFSRCRYRPRVMVLPDAAMLGITNEEKTPHHYDLSGTKGNVRHHAVLKPGDKTGVRFAPERDIVRFTCRLHPWEVAWVAVLAHPFHFVTGADGKYGVANLPPGQYTFEAWHESYRPVTRQVTVQPDQVLKVAFTLDRLKQ